MRKAILFCLAITLLGTMLISFSACNGILSSLYDEPETAKDFGFITIDHANHSGTVRVDATQINRFNPSILFTLSLPIFRSTSYTFARIRGYLLSVIIPLSAAKDY